MPTSHDIQRLILRELERNGPQNLYEIADEIAQAPFRVRAELRAMKRDRLVTGLIGSDSYVWAITDRGRNIVWRARQLGLMR